MSGAPLPCCLIKFCEQRGGVNGGELLFVQNTQNTIRIETQCRKMHALFLNSIQHAHAVPCCVVVLCCRVSPLGGRFDLDPNKTSGASYWWTLRLVVPFCPFSHNLAVRYLRGEKIESCGTCRHCIAVQQRVPWLSVPMKGDKIRTNEAVRGGKRDK